MKRVTITVPKWREMNPRSDYDRHPYWFRMNRAIASSPSLLELSPAQRWLWVCLLAECCRNNSESFTVTLSYLSKLTGVKESECSEALEILNGNGSLTVDCQPTVSSPQLQHNTTQHNTTQNNTKQNNATDSSLSVRCQFDFDALYELYPRKEGKSAGMKSCKTQIKTQADYDKLRLAIEKYSKHVLDKGTEARFIKQFSSFMNCWRDWLDPKTGTVDARVTAVPKTRAQMIEDRLESMRNKPEERECEPLEGF